MIVKHEKFLLLSAKVLAKLLTFMGTLVADDVRRILLAASTAEWIIIN